MSYPKRRPRVDDRDGLAVHVADSGSRTPEGHRQLPLPEAFWGETIFCGGKAKRCARAVLGEISYSPGDRDLLNDVVMLTPYEAEQLTDGSWRLGPGYWADDPDLGRGPRIPLPAVVRCPRCHGRRRVEPRPVRLA